MNKKLLASLMAGVMLVNQGASLSAVRPNQRGFWAENKNFIKGVLAGGVGTALAGTIAYLVHDCKEVLEVVEMEWPCDSDKSEEKFIDDLAEKFKEVRKSLSEGKIVKIKKTAFENAIILCSLFGWSNNENEKDKMKIVNQYMLGVADESYVNGTKLCDFTLKAVSKNNNTLNIDLIVEPSKNEELSTSEGSSTTSASQTDVGANFSNSSCMSTSDVKECIDSLIQRWDETSWEPLGDGYQRKRIKLDNFQGIKGVKIKSIEDELVKKISSDNKGGKIVRYGDIAQSGNLIDEYKELVVDMGHTANEILVYFVWI